MESSHVSSEKRMLSSAVDCRQEAWGRREDNFMSPTPHTKTNTNISRATLMTATPMVATHTNHEKTDLEWVNENVYMYVCLLVCVWKRGWNGG